jgi:hypothetical protein
MRDKDVSLSLEINCNFLKFEINSIPLTYIVFLDAFQNLV